MSLTNLNGIGSPTLRQRNITTSWQQITLNTRSAATDIDNFDAGTRTAGTDHYREIAAFATSPSWLETYSKYSFFFSYKNFRLTLPTVLAWAAAMCFHQACQM